MIWNKQRVTWQRMNLYFVEVFLNIIYNKFYHRSHFNDEEHMDMHIRGYIVMLRA